MQNKDVVAAMITLLDYEPMSLYASMELSNISDWSEENLASLKKLLTSEKTFVQSNLFTIISSSEAVYERFSASLLERINSYPQELQEQLIGLYFCKEQVAITEASQVELVKFIASLAPNQPIGSMYSVNDLYGIIHGIPDPIPSAVNAIKDGIKSIKDNNILYSSINFLSQHKKIDDEVCKLLKELVTSESTDYFVSLTAREALRAHDLLSGETETYKVKPPATMLEGADSFSAGFLEAGDEDINKKAAS